MIALLHVGVGIVVVVVSVVVPANVAYEMGAFVLTTFDDEFHHDAQFTNVKCRRQQEQRNQIIGRITTIRAESSEETAAVWEKRKVNNGIDSAAL